MVTRLQDARVEIELITEQAERELEKFKDEVDREEKKPREEAEKPKRMMFDGVLGERSQEGMASTYEFKAWAKDKAWSGVEKISGERNVRDNATKIIGAVRNVAHNGTVGMLATTALAAFAASPLAPGAAIPMSGAMESGIRAAMEAGRLATLYSKPISGYDKAGPKPLPAPIQKLAEQDFGDVDNPLREAIGLEGDALDYAREGIIKTESALQAAIPTLNQTMAVATTMLKTPLGKSLDPATFSGFYAEGVYDFKRMEIESQYRAHVESTSFLIRNLGSMTLKKLNLSE